MLAAQQQKQIEEQAKTISENVKAIEAKDKQIAVLEEQTEYTRSILNSPSTVLVTQIAQDYGMGAKLFTIAGPVLVWGVSASVVYGVGYWLITTLM